jgi:tetratricopeptide (TPR) repeat protein
MPTVFDGSSNEVMERKAAMVREAEAAVRAGDSGRAIQLADQALSQGLEDPMFLNLRAMRLDAEGQTELAVADIRRAMMLRPWEPTLPNMLGMYLAKLGRNAEAMASFDTAVRIAPNFAHAHYAKGWLAEQMGELDLAVQAHEKALAADPRLAEALASLASIASLRGEWDGARDHAGRALAIDPMQPTATVALASAEVAAGEHEPAARRLRLLLDAQPNRLTPHARSVALGRLADALEGQGLTAEAFQAYGEEKALTRQVHAHRFAGQNPATVLDGVIGWLEALTDWPAGDDAAGPAAQHVFLLGFPRSGTTLLEQVLASHPDVVTLDEHEVLAEAGQAFLTSSAGLDRLAALGPEELSQLRADYWRRVREHGVEVEGKVLIDKLPLNTIKLPLIARLFPKARILFAVRDPRDVVLSCFRQHFDINAAMFELLSLEGAAAFYDRVMKLGTLAGEKLPLNLRQHRHEDLVEDFDAQTRATCDFIGLPWSDSLRDFAETAKGRDIRTPSAPQVRRGLYEQGMGQWRRYAGEMTPVMPVLQPWVDRFGYPTDPA